MNRKALSLLVAVVMLLSVVPAALSASLARGTYGARTTTEISQTQTNLVKPLPDMKGYPGISKVLESIWKASKNSGKKEVRLIIAPENGQARFVIKKLQEIGTVSPLSKPQYNFIVVTVPTSNIQEISKIPGIKYIWKDKLVKVPEPQEIKQIELITRLGYIPKEEQKPSTLGSSPFESLYDWDMEVINAPEAREKYGIDGSGAKVAVIDTGADPGQPYLQRTPEGDRKIIWWKDTTGEGNISIVYNFTASQIVNGVVNISLRNVTIDWGDYWDFLVQVGRDFYGRPNRMTILNDLNLTIEIPDGITSANGVYRFGFLPERYFDLNFDRNMDEIYFVLAVNSSLEYDTVYLYPIPLQINTTNASLDSVVQYLLAAKKALNSGDYLGYRGNYTLAVQDFLDRISVPSGGNYSFTIDLSKAIKLRPFNVASEFAPLGKGYSGLDVALEVGYLSLRHVAIGYTDVVVSDMDPLGTYVNFGWDGGEHGTHVSGTIAGYGEPNPYYPWPFNETGMIGVAPGAQLLEFKALSSTGYGSDSWIIASMFEAAEAGADIISMSLGGNSDYNDGTESAENFYVDYITNLFNVTFVIAAGNEGPAMNTVGSPGDSRFAITVGAYVDPEVWKYFGANPNVKVPPQVTDFSSRGPRMDGLLEPDVIAPGQDVFSLLPIYSIGGHGSWASDWWDGTSMATPHVSGVAALIVSYAKKKDFECNPLKIKDAILFSAKPISGYNLDEQGFGLVQADRAIARFSQIASEKTPLLYIGTTFTDFKTQAGTPWIPTKPAEYLTLRYGLPYLYGGIYIRNSEVASVPVKVYSIDYTGSLNVRSTVPWAIPTVSSVSVSKDGQATFFVSIDYSQLQTPGIYTGIIYIDDPNTKYVEGYIPVTVFVPQKPVSGKVTITDTYQDIGDTVHRYVFKVPEGTQKMVVNISTDSGNFLFMQLVPPTGVQVLNYLGYGAFGLRNRVIKLQNPLPGTWELVIWDEYELNTGWEFHSNITVDFYGITSEPKILTINAENSTASVSYVTLRNNLGTFNATLHATDNSTLYMDSLWDTGGVIYGYDYEFYIDDYYDPDLFKGAVYMEVSVVPQYIDQDIYVEAGYNLYSDYPTILVTSGGTLQIPLVNNSLPAYVYIGSDKPATVYLLVVYKNSTSKRIFQVGTTGPTEFRSGSELRVPVTVNASGDGTYFGALYATDPQGNVISVVPLVAEVGSPSILMSLLGTPVLGEKSELTLQLVDSGTLKPIRGQVLVTINGQEYVAQDGILKFYYTPLNSTPTLNVRAWAIGYRMSQKRFTLKVQEPVHQSVTSTKQMSINVVEGNAEIISSSIKWGHVSLTVNGTHGTNATIMVVLPKNAKVSDVTVTPKDHLISWYTVKETYAVYLFVTVEFASPVSIKVDFAIPHISLSTLNFISYRYYNMYSEQFEKLYSEAVKLGVNDTVLQQAKALNETAAQYYQKALDFADGNIFLHLSDPRLIMPLRQAYLHEMKAVKLLQKAIEEIQEG